jgi:plastocyanin
MNRSLVLSILVVCLGSRVASAAAGKAVITGRVVITKVLTKERVALPVYQLRGVSPSPQPTENQQNDPPGFDELSRVVVYLQGPGLIPGVPVRATLTQKSLRFHPEMVVVPVGSTVSFPNEDPIFHNVFSLSKAKHFDLGYYPKGQTRLVKFDRPGVVQVYCHIHTDMSAAILVVPSTLWTRPTPDGSFSMKGIPPGSYELVAWHRSAGFFRRRVTISGGQGLRVNFMIPVKESGSGEAVASRSRQ